MTDAAKRIADNLAQVRQRMDEAAKRSGRSADQVTLVGVTKYVEADLAKILLAAGCADLGESRPQQLWEKADAMKEQSVRWHLVGHLQRNKARRTLPLIALLHSADSLRLLSSVNQLSEQLSLTTSVLLEVNISLDVAKGGFSAEELPPLLPQIAQFRHIAVKGLMAMGALKGNAQVAQADFQRLRELRDHMRKDCPEEIELDELSMGMSGDFEIAIEQGATMVRVGSALFEGLRS